MAIKCARSRRMGTTRRGVAVDRTVHSTRRECYTLRVLHIESVTRRECYTSRVLHVESVTRRECYTSRVLHVESVTRRECYTSRVLHVESVTRRECYTSRCGRAWHASLGATRLGVAVVNGRHARSQPRTGGNSMVCYR